MESTEQRDDQSHIAAATQRSQNLILSNFRTKAMFFWICHSLKCEQSTNNANNRTLKYRDMCSEIGCFAQIIALKLSLHTNTKKVYNAN